MAIKTVCDRCKEEVGPFKQEFMHIGKGKHTYDLCEGCKLSLRMWFERMLKE